MKARATILSSICLGAALAAGGCTQTTGSQTAGMNPAATGSATPSAPSQPDWPKLPDGAACTADLERFQAILKSDVDTGNLNRSVYDKVQTELKPAAEACADGKDAEARKLVQAARRRHGYRA